VLQWLLEQRDDAQWRSVMLELPLYQPEECAGGLGVSLNSRQLDEAFTLLHGYGLIAMAATVRGG
jgi:hypothetical protein